MALEIRTKPAIIGINRTPSKLSIEQPKAQVSGSISLPQVKIEASLPKITIDQTQSFNESGLKSVTAFSDDYVNYAKRIRIESMGRIVSQGNALKDINLGGNPIANNARYNAVDQFQHEFGMVTMPRTRPRINVIEGQLDISVQEGQINQRIEAQKPIINYQKGKIEFYTKQYNSININYLSDSVDLKV